MIAEPRVRRQVTCEDVLDMFEFATTDFDTAQRGRFMQAAAVGGVVVRRDVV